MTSQTRQIIQDLNERILNQSVVIQTLVDILVEQGVISEKELDKRLIENTEILNQELLELHQDGEDESDFFFPTNYFGPLGEA